MTSHRVNTSPDATRPPARANRNGVSAGGEACPVTGTGSSACRDSACGPWPLSPAGAVASSSSVSRGSSRAAWSSV